MVFTKWYYRYMTHWIRNSVLYQIYPRSFYDTNRDGVGDMAGITEKLPYLQELGIGAIWISPFYPSPMKDFGYDISDYREVDPLFGDLSDFKTLLTEAHSRNIKVVIDFVPNHTSDQHAWFAESRSSLDNPKRDWYTWRDAAADGSPPNNWLAHFGGPAWTKDETTGQYYLHSFLPEQPDLNWDNPEVRKAMADTVRYWLEMGVDGLRVDAINWLSKDKAMRDDPIDPTYSGPNPYKALIHTYSSMGPHLYRYLRDLEEAVKEFDDRFMVVESYPDISGDQSHYLSFYRELDPSATAPFNFEGISLPWNAAAFRTSLSDFTHKLRSGDTAVYSFGNHDKPRLASRFGAEHTRTAAMLLLTLPGAPIIYYGDEIGMHDVKILSTQAHDPFELNNPGKGLGRDPERTPMQWSDHEYAGFSTSKPWLPVADDYVSTNVEQSEHTADSLLTLYKKLLELRKTIPALRSTDFKIIDTHPEVLSYERRDDQGVYTVHLNFTQTPLSVGSDASVLVISTENRSEFDGTLLPYEGVVLTSDNKTVVQ